MSPLLCSRYPHFSLSFKVHVYNYLKKWFLKIAKYACWLQVFCKESQIKVAVTVDAIFRFLATDTSPAHLMLREQT